MLKSLRAFVLFASLLLLAACTTAEGGPAPGKPFSYAKDRCVGSYNQCSLDCTDIDFGPARSACTERCLTVEDRCYLTGDEGTALSVGESIGDARTEEEKEAAFQRWKARKERERKAAKDAAKPQ